jgi:hypothetical protein
MNITGDNQYISVDDNGQGGAVVNYIGPIPVEAEEAEDVEYIKVSYNADDSEFSVIADDLPFYINAAAESKFIESPANIKTYSSDYLGYSAEPLVFDAPPSSYRTIYLRLESGFQRGMGGIWSMTWSGSSITATNDYTEKMQNRHSGFIGVFQEIRLYSDGTHQIILPETTPVLAIAGTNTQQPILYWNANTVYLVDLVDQSTGLPTTLSKTAPTGTEEDLILGVDLDGSTPVLDFESNSGGYDRYANIGRLKVETIASTVVATVCYLFMSQTPTLAATAEVVINEMRDNFGTLQHRDRTLSFQNGLFIQDTSGSWSDY